MPNPNETALRGLLDWAMADSPSSERLAQRLAERGVLVVSDAVLTDEEVRELVIVDKTSDSLRAWDSCEDFRWTLSRLAKGETT